MHELNDRIATKSVLYGMADGKVADRERRRLAGQESRQIHADGPRQAAAENAGQADVDRFHEAALRLDRAPPAKRDARAQGRAAGKDRARLPAARHRRGRLHPLRPRLLGRADDRALCRRGNVVGDPRRTRRCASSRTSPSATPIPTCTASCSAPDYKPEPYIHEEYKRARDHKWYMTSRMITRVRRLFVRSRTPRSSIDEFDDIIGRHFKQPKEGLGFDNSPSSHMWRTLNWPTRFL